MRTLFLLCLIALLYSGCKDSTNSVTQNQPTYPLYIDVQSQFKNEVISIYVDNNMIVSRQFNTDNIIGLAGQDSLQLTEGEHTIDVQFPAKALNIRQKFQQKAQKQWVGVVYIIDENILRVHFQDIFFGYD